MSRSLAARLATWFRDRLRPRFDTVMVEEDPPDRAMPKTLYIVTEDGEPWSAAMLCPCGCGATLHMNLLLDERPVWRVTHYGDGTSSLHPSVWRQKECRAHFWFRRGRVYWTADQSSPLWRDLRLLIA